MSGSPKDVPPRPVLFIDDSWIAEHIGAAIGITDDDRVFDIGRRITAVIDIDTALIAFDVEAEIFHTTALEPDIFQKIICSGIQRDVDFRRTLADSILDIAIAFVAAGILIVAILHG